MVKEAKAASHADLFLFYLHYVCQKLYGPWLGADFGMVCFESQIRSKQSLKKSW